MQEYLKQVEDLSYEFSRLLAEALGLKPDALAPFYDQAGGLQHRAKVCPYLAFGERALMRLPKGRKVPVAGQCHVRSGRGAAL